MLIDLPSGRTCWLIGDPHLGRKFEVGVPLHRRGEREARQLEKFVEELATPCDVNVMVGDLFEHPHVGHSVVVAAAQAYLEAAERHPDTMFIAMPGNHDLPRNLGVVGAWDAFEEIVRDRYDNLYVDRSPAVLDDEIAIFPWEWGVSALEQVEQHSYLFREGQIAIGHWDLKSYGGDDSHLAPVKALSELGIADFYSGHYHLEGDYEVDGYTVHCTGSLEPYTHAEDATGETYQTLSLEGVLANPEALKDKCVRVILQPGEELPSDIDCLAMTAKRAAADEGETEQVSFSTFDWQKIMEDALKGLDPEVKNFITDRLTG